jgi:hypothetical protein
VMHVGFVCTILCARHTFDEYVFSIRHVCSLLEEAIVAPSLVANSVQFQEQYNNYDRIIVVSLVHSNCGTLANDHSLSACSPKP